LTVETNLPHHAFMSHSWQSARRELDLSRPLASPDAPGWISPPESRSCGETVSHGLTNGTWASLPSRVVLAQEQPELTWQRPSAARSGPGRQAPLWEPEPLPWPGDASPSRPPPPWSGHGRSSDGRCSARRSASATASWAPRAASSRPGSSYHSFSVSDPASSKSSGSPAPGGQPA